jgi:ribosomal protein S27E
MDGTVRPVVRWLRMEQGRLATGDPTRVTFEKVRVVCHACGGETVFPVTFGQARPEGKCLHCGAII